MITRWSTTMNRILSTTIFLYFSGFNSFFHSRIVAVKKWGYSVIMLATAAKLGDQSIGTQSKRTDICSINLILIKFFLAAALTAKFVGQSLNLVVGVTVESRNFLFKKHQQRRKAHEAGTTATKLIQ